MAAAFPAGMPSPLKTLGRLARGGMDLGRLWGEWDQWRAKEEAAFAKSLREKVCPMSAGLALAPVMP